MITLRGMLIGIDTNLVQNGPQNPVPTLICTNAKKAAANTLNCQPVVLLASFERSGLDQRYHRMEAPPSHSERSMSSYASITSTFVETNRSPLITASYRRSAFSQIDAFRRVVTRLDAVKP